jgi:hypothetical protein
MHAACRRVSAAPAEGAADTWVERELSFLSMASLTVLAEAAGPTDFQRAWTEDAPPRAGWKVCCAWAETAPAALNCRAKTVADLWAHGLFKKEPLSAFSSADIDGAKGWQASDSDSINCRSPANRPAHDHAIDDHETM